MKTENQIPCNQGTQHHLPQSGFLSCAAVASSPKGTILDRNFRPLLLIAGATASLCISACVDPYAGNYGGRTSISSSSYYQPGYRVQSLPSGYRSETISGKTYYYHSGNYYRRSSNGYEVIEAPRTSRYYNDYGQMRQGHSSDHRQDAYGHSQHDQRDHRGYEMTQLPYGSRAITFRGREYYQVGDRYYVRNHGVYSQVNRPY